MSALLGIEFKDDVTSDVSFIARGRSVEQAFARAAEAARLVGDVLDARRHERAADVKAATAHGLRVAERDGIWEIAVTLDV